MASSLYRNAVMSVLEALCMAITLFFLFRLVIADLGIAAVGAWSLVAATLSFSQIADIGLGGALQRFVPAALSRGRKDDAIFYIKTALVSIGALYLVIALAGYPLFAFVLRASVSPADRPVVLELLPYALASFWLSNVAMVFLSGLVSLQRYDLRSGISIVGMIVQFVTAVVLVPKVGIVGLVWAQIVQNFILLLCGAALLRRHLPGVPWIPIGFSKPHFREMLRYGVNLQMFFIANFLFEPTTKLFLSNIAGLSWVGYYELANRMVRQARNLVVSASQVVVPALAHVNEEDPSRAFSIYMRASDLNWLLGWPILGMLAAMVPAISELWIGRTEPDFIWAALVLTFAWILNLISAPSYFMALGTGRLKWNLIGWITISGTNVVLDYTFGHFFGGRGIIAGTAMALGAGSLVTLLGNHRMFGGQIRDLLTTPALRLAGMSVAAAAISVIAYGALRMEWSRWPAIGACFLATAAILTLGFFLHPDSRGLIRTLKLKLSRAAPVETG